MDAGTLSGFQFPTSNLQLPTAMFGHWTPLVWLVATLVPLFFLKRWINRHVQGLGLLLLGDNETAMLLYFVLLLPGILIHELSHWLAARLLAVRTGKISLWPSRGRGNQMRLGSVRIARTDPFRASLIGLAPLLSGCLAILIIGQLILSLGDLGEVLLNGDWGAVWQSLLVHLRAPDFWLWLYLIFSISNAMLPSETDREPWRPVLLFVCLAALLFYLTGWVRQMPEVVTTASLSGLSYLAYAFSLTVVVDAMFIAVLFVLEVLVSRLTGKRVEY
ncbi:MAG: hypothetical protein FJ014_03230 [Chloroflexi bacterium]|nr:hypothetical protein [Chloroflexota bacterium]